ncbi:glycosyltransferase [Haladaptatus sp. DYF46]|uniref:glycosyltransferase n=1 Tax=Haladaptatus sp. DYF46 TaxID=2886041 RepID=UPI001E5CA918|nr:glycosyltransferase [Haladaptatus sp. DYF46]
MRLDSHDVAILHDRFPAMGGGERFAIEAARVLDAPIFTMYVADGVESPDDVTIVPIRQGKYTRGLSGHLLEWKNEGMNPLETMSVALDWTDAHDELANYDVVLESAPLSKSYVPPVDQTVLHYPHSPPRWLYDLYRERLAAFDYPGVQLALKGYAKWWRTLDKEANDYIDRFVANSELVRDRIQRYYNRDATVVYPPVTGDWRDEGDDGYFVTWSRLAPEKRIGLVIDAFAGLDERLLVVGDGKERERLERKARPHDNVELLGFLPDVEDVVSRATAVVYAPKDEDFGLVGAEALTAGKPLIGVNEGYTRQQVVEGKTGLGFAPTVRSLRETVEAFDPDDFDTDDIQEFARRYDRRTFAQSLREVVDRTHREAAEKRTAVDADDTKPIRIR